MYDVTELFCMLDDTADVVGIDPSLPKKKFYFISFQKNVLYQTNNVPTSTCSSSKPLFSIIIFDVCSISI